MHVNQQQSVGDISTGDNTTQLLQSSTFEQKSLVDKICTEVSRLINNIINRAKNENNAFELIDTALKLRKSISSNNFVKFVKSLRKNIAEKLISEFIEQLVEKYTTEEQRKVFIKEVCEVVLDTFPGFKAADLFLQILNKKHVTEAPYATDGEQVIEVPQVIREQQATTSRQNISEQQQITTERQQFIEIQHVTKGQQVTTESKNITEKQQVSEVPSATEGQQVDAEEDNLNEEGFFVEKGKDEKGDIPLDEDSGYVEYSTGKKQVTEMQQVSKVPTERQQVTAEQDNFNEREFFIEKGEDKKSDISLDEGSGYVEYSYVIEGYSDRPKSLHDAVKQGNLIAVKYFVESGADVNAKDEYGDNPLHSAAKRDNLDIVKYLVEKGADINAKDKRQGLTSLHIATEMDKLGVVKYLVEKGANINMEDDIFDCTSLHLAVNMGYLDMVKYLINNGATLNPKDKIGETPVHYAVKSCNLDILRYLVEKGANVNVTNTEGETILIIAFNTPDYFCDRRLDMMKYLIDKGVDVNARNEQDRSVLCVAAGGRRWNDFDFLIENGADINAKSRCGGNTLLHLALMGDHYWCHQCIYPSPSPLSTIKYLVERGANVNVKNDVGKTPLDMARGFREITEFLLNHQQGSRNRRDVLSRNSWMNNSIVNWVKSFLPPSIESPALLTFREYNNTTTVTALLEINTTVVNNTLLLGIVASGLFNKTQYRPKQSILLSPREQSMSLNNMDEEMIIKAIQKGKEKFEDPL